MADNDRKDLERRGVFSTPILDRIVAAQKQLSGTSAAAAAPAETKAGKETTAPLDIRPRRARNKPKPKHATAKHRSKHNGSETERRPHERR